MVECAAASWSIKTKNGESTISQKMDDSENDKKKKCLIESRPELITRVLRAKLDQNLLINLQKIKNSFILDILHIGDHFG